MNTNIVIGITIVRIFLTLDGITLNPILARAKSPVA